MEEEEGDVGACMPLPPLCTYTVWIDREQYYSLSPPFLDDACVQWVEGMNGWISLLITPFLDIQREEVEQHKGTDNTTMPPPISLIYSFDCPLLLLRCG